MDAIDLNILSMLQSKGRVSNAELARANGLAPSSMLERVRRLEERGTIKGYQAILDPLALGYTIHAIVMINLNRHQAGQIDQFEDEIRSVEEVKACYHLTGRYDYLLTVVARDLDHLGQLVKKTLGSMQGVEKQETFVTLSTIKADTGFALDHIEPDK